jgi:hypothetical protein
MIIPVDGKNGYVVFKDDKELTNNNGCFYVNINCSHPWSELIKNGRFLDCNNKKLVVQGIVIDHKVIERNTIKDEISQRTVGDPKMADARFDKSYNYGLGAYDNGGVYFKNEHRPMYKAYGSRNKPWNNWAFNIYEYYRNQLLVQSVNYENNDDEVVSVTNIGGGRLPSNAKSPIKYFYGRDRSFATSRIIDKGARQTYGYGEWHLDHSNGILGEGPERWGHQDSWFHERDYTWISRTRANRVLDDEIFDEHLENCNDDLACVFEEMIGQGDVDKPEYSTDDRWSPDIDYGNYNEILSDRLSDI